MRGPTSPRCRRRQQRPGRKLRRRWVTEAVGAGGLPPSEADGASDRSALTREAMARAAGYSAAGDAGAALRWLDRAARLAPGDQTVALSLASAALGQDDARAAALFAAIAERVDLREAWLGLAAARRRLGDPAAAATALARVLSRNAPAAGLDALADTITREAGEPGWCSLAGDGRLALHRAGHATGGTIVLRLDGRELAARTARLPAGWQRAESLRVTADGKDLLGSPLSIRAICRVAGCVTAREGGLDGWAWHPGEPDRDPVLTVRAATGRRLVRLTAADTIVTADISPMFLGALARPRGFHVPAAALAGVTGLVHVLDQSGNDLLGSPLDASAEQRTAVAASVTLSRLYPAGAPRAQTGRARTAPLPPPAIPAATIGPSPPVGATPLRRRNADVVLPVHGGMPTVLACLDSVFATIPQGTRVIVVDDASPEPALRQALDALAARRRILLIRAPHNRGFAASANAGIAACPGHDVVLLNSDTLVPPDWLARLSEAARAACDIGTVTPLSNDASILSYPGPVGSNAVPDRTQADRLDALAKRANGRTLVDIPVGVGFCLYIRRDCLDAVGLFRADVFAQGYGEENDFCLRARHLGWRHVAAPGVFVAHVGGASFGAAAAALRARNGAILERLHPGYEHLVQGFGVADPLAPARRALDVGRWRAARRRGQPAVILVTHEEGGGVERVIAVSAKAHRAAGRRPIVLRPGRCADGGKAVVVGDGDEGGYPNLRYALPDELPSLLHLLKAERPAAAEVHHLVGHDPAVLTLIERLRLPYDVHVHDYAWFCPRIALVGADKRYCGEPELPGCEACVADAGSLLGDGVSVAGLRERSARLLAGARRVLAPSADAAARMHRHFPALRPDVLAPENDVALPPPAPPSGPARSGPAPSGLAPSGPAPSGLAPSGLAPSGPAPSGPAPSGPAPSGPAPSGPAPSGLAPSGLAPSGLAPSGLAPSGPAPFGTAGLRPAGRCRVCVVGAIGVHKGYDVLLACARDAAARRLPLEFIVVGHTIGDRRLLDTGHVFVTGEYRPDEAVALIRAQDASLALLPSIWPETWCFCLTEAWQAGLGVAAFDIGAPAERIRRTGRGFLLPLGLPSAAINNALMSATGLTIHRRRC